LSNPFCDPGAPCRSIRTISGGVVRRAHPTARSRYVAAPLTYGVPVALKAQKPIGTRTALMPAAARVCRSSKVRKVSQCSRRICGACCGRRSQRVYSSMMPRVWSTDSKIEGVIHLRCQLLVGVRRGRTALILANPPG
jgi:hypothetical protein